MAKLIFLPVADRIQSGTYLLYDGACGTGGMLTVAEDTLQQLAGEHGKQVATHLYGQVITNRKPAHRKGRAQLTGPPTTDITPAEYDRYTVKTGDLLVCEGGEVGRCAIWNNQLDVCGFQQALHRLGFVRPDRDLPRFMYYSLRAAATSDAFSDGHVSTIAHLTGDKLRAHPFPFPPLTEQTAIVRALDQQLSRLESAGAIARGEIELLREYRARLIADMVTGKLDVRDAKASTTSARSKQKLKCERVESAA